MHQFRSVVSVTSLASLLRLEMDVHFAAFEQPTPTMDKTTGAIRVLPNLLALSVLSFASTSQSLHHFAPDFMFDAGVGDLRVALRSPRIAKHKDHGHSRSNRPTNGDLHLPDAVSGVQPALLVVHSVSSAVSLPSSTVGKEWTEDSLTPMLTLPPDAVAGMLPPGDGGLPLSEAAMSLLQIISHSSVRSVHMTPAPVVKFHVRGPLSPPLATFPELAAVNSVSAGSLQLPRVVENPGSATDLGNLTPRGALRIGDWPRVPTAQWLMGAMPLITSAAHILSLTSEPSYAEPARIILWPDDAGPNAKVHPAIPSAVVAAQSSLADGTADDNFALSPSTRAIRPLKLPDPSHANVVSASGTSSSMMSLPVALGSLLAHAFEDKPWLPTLPAGNGMAPLPTSSGAFPLGSGTGQAGELGATPDVAFNEPWSQLLVPRDFVVTWNAPSAMAAAASALPANSAVMEKRALDDPFPGFESSTHPSQLWAAGRTRAPLLQMAPSLLFSSSLAAARMPAPEAAEDSMQDRLTLIPAPYASMALDSSMQRVGSFSSFRQGDQVWARATAALLPQLHALPENPRRADLHGQEQIRHGFVRSISSLTVTTSLASSLPAIWKRVSQVPTLWGGELDPSYPNTDDVASVSGSIVSVSSFVNMLPNLPRGVQPPDELSDLDDGTTLALQWPESSQVSSLPSAGSVSGSMPAWMPFRAHADTDIPGLAAGTT
jgi:hypothetical protein